MKRILISCLMLFFVPSLMASNVYLNFGLPDSDISLSLNPDPFEFGVGFSRHSISLFGGYHFSTQYSIVKFFAMPHVGLGMSSNLYPILGVAGGGELEFGVFLVRLKVLLSILDLHPSLGLGLGLKL